MTDQQLSARLPSGNHARSAFTAAFIGYLLGDSKTLLATLGFSLLHLSSCDLRSRIKDPQLGMGEQPAGWVAHPLSG
jgi:hypothetical protein